MNIIFHFLRLLSYCFINLKVLFSFRFLNRELSTELKKQYRKKIYLKSKSDNHSLLEKRLSFIVFKKYASEFYGLHFES